MFQKILNYLKTLPKIVWGATTFIAAGAISLTLATSLSAIGVKDLFILIASYIGKFIFFQIPVWLLLVAISVVITVMIFYCKPKLPKWYKFTKIMYKGYLFTWVYKNGEPQLTEELCKQCHCALGDLQCPLCGSLQRPFLTTANFHSFGKDLLRVIKWNINSGNYKEWLKLSRTYPRIHPKKSVADNNKIKK